MVDEQYKDVENDFTVTRNFEKYNSKVAIKKNKSALASIRLANMRAKIFALYRKAKLFDEGEEFYISLIDQADLIAQEHDMMRMIYALDHWEIDPKCFVLQLEEPIQINKDNIEMLKEDVFIDFNKFVTEYWEPTGNKTPEEEEEDDKNLEQPSTSILSPLSKESNLTLKN